jgi:hypothetical protein
MSLDPKKMIHALKCCLLNLLWWGLLLANAPLQAANCSVLRLQTIRSSGTDIIDNACDTETDLAVGTLLELQAGTRLWLETPETNLNAASFQIICQNQSSSSLKIRIKSPFLPWIEPVDTVQCNAWINNRLVCSQDRNPKAALLCAIAQRARNLPIPDMQQKTSVTMRGVTNPTITQSPQASRQWADFAKSGIDLCRKITNAYEPVTLTWRINTTGETVSASIAATTVDQQLADCALEALKNTHFPSVMHELSVTYKF